jgi:hypothetical protein
LRELLVRYQDAANVDKVRALHRKVEETTEVAQLAIEDLLARGENLDRMVSVGFFFFFLPVVACVRHRDPGPDLVVRCLSSHRACRSCWVGGWVRWLIALTVRPQKSEELSANSKVFLKSTKKLKTCGWASIPCTVM